MHVYLLNVILVLLCRRIKFWEMGHFGAECIIVELGILTVYKYWWSDFKFHIEPELHPFEVYNKTLIYASKWTSLHIHTYVQYVSYICYDLYRIGGSVRCNDPVSANIIHNYNIASILLQQNYSCFCCVVTCNCMLQQFHNYLHCGVSVTVEFFPTWL